MATKERFIIESMFMIADKDGKDVPFILNHAQATLDDSFTGRDILPKARQRGLSSYYIARALAKCLSVRNTNAVIVAHEDTATKKMLKKAHYMINHIRGPKPVIKNSSANQITFPKMGSTLSIGTAGSDNVGVGDTIHFLHCSEVALWQNPKALLSGLFQAVPKNGEIGMESTGRGQGNYYHRAVMRAAKGSSRYRLHFFDWQSDPEYSYDLTTQEEEDLKADFNPDWNELELYETNALTLGQLSWRRDKIEEMDYDLDLFKQEYPMYLDECFQASGRSVFNTINYKPTKDFEKIDAHTHILKDHPNPNMHYAIGGDVGGGVGQDNSVAEIVCLETMEQVGEYVNNKISPDIFGLKLAELGKLFNYAYMTVENNNHGIVTIKELTRLDAVGNEIYPDYLLYKKVKGQNGTKEEVDLLTDIGFRTSVKSKPFLVGNLRKLVVKDLTVHSEIIKDEMDSFIETETGKLQAEEGCHDDTVMGMAMCMIGFERAVLYTTTTTTFKPTILNDPFSLESIIKELHTGQQGYPIAPQVSAGDDNENTNTIH